MQANFLISVSAEVDPEKIKEKFNTKGMTARESIKVLRRRVFEFLDQEYSGRGQFGDYTLEIQEDVEDALKELGVTLDTKEQDTDGQEDEQ